MTEHVTNRGGQRGQRLRKAVLGDDGAARPPHAGLCVAPTSPAPRRRRRRRSTGSLTVPACLTSTFLLQRQGELVRRRPGLREAFGPGAWGGAPRGRRAVRRPWPQSHGGALGAPPPRPAPPPEGEAPGPARAAAAAGSPKQGSSAVLRASGVSGCLVGRRGESAPGAQASLSPRPRHPWVALRLPGPAGPRAATGTCSARDAQPAPGPAGRIPRPRALSGRLTDVTPAPVLLLARTPACVTRLAAAVAFSLTCRPGLWKHVPGGLGVHLAPLGDLMLLDARAPSPSTASFGALPLRKGHWGVSIRTRFSRS